MTLRDKKNGEPKFPVFAAKRLADAAGGAAQFVADGAKDSADAAAGSGQSSDSDDGDETNDQSVFNEALAFFLNHKIADHFRYLLEIFWSDTQIISAIVMPAKKNHFFFTEERKMQFPDPTPKRWISEVYQSEGTALFLDESGPFVVQ